MVIGMPATCDEAPATKRRRVLARAAAAAQALAASVARVLVALSEGGMLSGDVAGTWDDA